MTKNLKQDRKEPYIFFISNMEDAWDILKQYKERWKIECCFRHLKSNGFDMEAMNMKQDVKIELMTGIVVAAYAIAIREGVLAYSRKPFRKKKYKNGKVYYEVSIFRKGLEIIDGILNNSISLLKYLIRSIYYSGGNPYVNVVLIKNVQ